MSTCQESNTEGNVSLGLSTQNENIVHKFWKDWKYWTPITMPVMIQLIMFVDGCMNHNRAELRACQENDTAADIRLSSADVLKFVIHEFSLKDLIDVESKRKWTDLIEIAWEKRKETLLADLEKSGKSLTDALHKELNKTMAENVNMQNQKILDQLGECHRTKEYVNESLRKIQKQFDGIGNKMKTHENDIGVIKSEIKNNFKTVDMSIRNMENQIDGTKQQVKTLENDITKTKEKLEGMDKHMETLENDITKTKEKLEGVDKHMETLENDITKTKEKLEGVDKHMETLENDITKTKEKLEGVDKHMETLENDITKTKEKLEGVDKHMETLENDITKTKEKLEGVDKHMETLENDITKTKEKLEGVDKQMETLENDITKVGQHLKVLDNDMIKAKEKHEVDKKIKTVENKMTYAKEKPEVDKQMKTLENEMTKANKKLEEVGKQMKVLDVDMAKNKEKLEGVNKQMETLENGMTETKIKVEEVDGQQNIFYKSLYDINVYIIVLFLAEVIHIIIDAYAILLPRPKAIDRTLSLSQSSDTITERVKRKELKEGLLIVSFHPSTQPFHHDALNALSEIMKTSPVKVLIQSFKDLMNVEPHKLVIIFVDFNHRNIILENEETEIGNLRNQTTKQFLSLKCDVFVVYCKDKGSQDLPPYSLYNPRLHSIYRHPVLSELKRNNRILSINEKFHPHQVEHLKMCCQQLGRYLRY